MTNYQPVKLTFDLDDPHHKEMYDYLKSQTNGSAFIRLLLYQSKYGQRNLVVKEQEVIKSERTVTDVVSESSSASVQQPIHNILKEVEPEVDVLDLI